MNSSPDIFQRVRELRAQPRNRDMTEREALSLLARRRKCYGRTRVKQFSAQIEQPLTLGNVAQIAA